MADAVTEISLDTLHTAIAADIAEAFPALKTVEFYREENDRKSLPLPACLLELTEFEEANDLDPGTDQQAVDARFEARIIVGFRTANAKREVRKLAAALAAWLRNRRWADPANCSRKLPTGAARFLGAMPDEFDPRLDQYEVWRVEWAQVLHLGDTVWKGDGVQPSEIYVGYSPEIGPENLAKYLRVHQMEEPRS